ncbi:MULTISPECIES: Crp/Fnr family transcriptional regulator [unclassified Sphingomonas]|uniref:Crp/Fnr family transcriptional regulator n=1 Tax=unclassified Sphingomonas TaxID=196159 RepID=UPI0006F67456|nr:MULTISPECIES: cyclic nucleotide-binding domain-containing protein [unclassified Sphingomonas]KQX22731.1 cyclic nucleotide-binding protein [Sphingomonas sp. Root1294]KQY67789.1 cyclic nucleotide-binding protein [Sphingomonas sp. Root50]KRB88712.1 cyclic nucleotide-binding protein [Sphingomonas sp. Root720]
MQNARYIAAGLSDADMLWLLSVGKLRGLRPGDRLVAPGKPVNDLFFVIGGLLEVRLDDGTRVAELHQGDVVGEMSFVERHSPLVSVVAAEPTEMLAIPRKLILDRFEQEPVFAARFYRALAVFLSERLRETTAAVRAQAKDLHDDKADKAARLRFSRLFSKSGP